MQNPSTPSLHPKRLLYLFLALHLFLWTTIPALVRYNLPLDSIEGTIWGHQLQWGYDKNPFLNGWLTALATSISHNHDWAVYLFSQLSVVACFWAVWKIAKNMLTLPYALIAVLILEGVQYYNFHAIDFNDNTLELGLWALTTLCFYNALRTPSKLSWILTGCFAALGMMAKYYTCALLAGMALFLFLDRENRKQLLTRAPYLGLLVFLAIILPHAIWLCFHDFITVNYVFKRASSPPSAMNHIFYPAQFIWQQLQVFLPSVILLLLLFIGKKPTLNPHKQPLTLFNRNFLFYVGVGPLLLTALLSVLFGIKLRAGWGMPLLSLWGIILVAFIQPRLSPTKVRAFFAGIIVLITLCLFGYSFSLIDSADTTSANFPGREIARTFTQQWQSTYHTPLSYVAGSRWVGGNIGFYSADHPAVYIEWDKAVAPWIDLASLNQKGGIFVWDMNDNETMPPEVRAQFPRLLASGVMEFNWHRNKRGLEPIKIGYAILPPTP